MNSENSPHLLGSASDHILLGRAADGDTAAFAVIVRRYAPMLRAYFTRITNDPFEIDQLVGASLKSVWRELPHLSRADYLQTFLLLIADAKTDAALQTPRMPAA